MVLSFSITYFNFFLLLGSKRLLQRWNMSHESWLQSFLQISMFCNVRVMGIQQGWWRDATCLQSAPKNEGRLNKEVRVHFCCKDADIYMCSQLNTSWRERTEMAKCFRTSPAEAAQMASKLQASREHQSLRGEKSGDQNKHPAPTCGVS